MAELNQLLEVAVQTATALAEDARETRELAQTARETRLHAVKAEIDAALEESHRQFGAMRERLDSWEQQLVSGGEDLEKGRAELAEASDDTREAAEALLEALRADVESLLAEKDRRQAELQEEVEGTLSAFDEQLEHLDRIGTSLEERDRALREGALAKLRETAEQASEKVAEKRQQLVQELEEYEDSLTAATEQLVVGLAEAVAELRERTAATVKELLERTEQNVARGREEILEPALAKLHETESEVHAILDVLPQVLQEAVQDQTLAVEALGNLSKKLHDSALSIIREIE